MMLDGKVLKTLRYRLGHETIHTVYEAEAVAVILGLHLLSHSKRLLTRAVELI